jgi:hypothetical protein
MHATLRVLVAAMVLGEALWQTAGFDALSD